MICVCVHVCVCVCMYVCVCVCMYAPYFTFTYMHVLILHFNQVCRSIQKCRPSQRQFILFPNDNNDDDIGNMPLLTYDHYLSLLPDDLEGETTFFGHQETDDNSEQQEALYLSSKNNHFYIHM